MPPIKLALVGLGKIARDQHLPALAANPDYQLIALVSRSIHEQQALTVAFPEAKLFTDLDQLLASGLEIDAVSLCAPPQVRHAQAARALAAGCDVMLEKPPGSGINDVQALIHQAERHGRVLFATWHSRYAPQVEPARAWLESKRVTALKVSWREDVRHWHFNQEWVWQPGGLGVFDPGINALSIVTRLLPDGLYLTKARLDFPSNRQTPIAARLEGALAGRASGPVEIELDWLKTGEQSWDIEIGTDQGRIELTHGGSRMLIDGEQIAVAGEQEYPGLYARFSELVARRKSDVDLTPLALAADAFLLGERREVDAFEW
ncbi:Gfo/Idh/MocA family protein [Halotalea alkalilenta]|uniref:Galactose 1-dehydrogenase n=1 Tax=Halotalea alkalilenta TaxID=376489 RepID=A0A172YAL6_9GAMM|nr:Gfo/Idh/MocA family oxidoreductase [Halotalea alkalilenta]ANF56291.1 galactose 1-dehydrogenase [Halotalea alkalilenta]